VRENLAGGRRMAELLPSNPFGFYVAGT